MEHVPTATREVLAQRLEEEFSGEIDWSATASELTDRHRQRLGENVGLLIGPWIQDKAQRYAALPMDERGAYLDRLIDTLQQWRGLDELSAGSGAGEPAPPGLMARARQELDAMKEHVSSAEQQQAREFVIALQTRWAVRELSQRLEKAAETWFRVP